MKTGTKTLFLLPSSTIILTEAHVNSFYSIRVVAATDGTTFPSSKRLCIQKYTNIALQLIYHTE